MKGRILFRVEANQSIGFGHLVRSVAIADTLSGYELLFTSTNTIDNFLKTELDSEYKWIRLKDTNDFFDLLKKDDIVVVDGYQFTSEYIQKIKSFGTKTICIDDLANSFFDADVILNPTPSFDPAQYHAPIYTQFCLGLSFALLRPSFLELARKMNIDKQKDSLFICFGGSDPLNKTAIALDAALTSNAFSEINVVLGPAYSFLETIKSQLVNSSSVILHSNLDEKTMAELMEKSEYAILPSSGILLEGIAAKIKIISGFYIENQKIVYQKHLLLNSFTDANNFSKEGLFSAINKVKNATVASNLIDGFSMQRIGKIIDQLSLESSCILRKASTEDINLTFEWANNSETRKYAFNKDEISFESHKKWFSEKVSSANCLYTILEHNKQNIGSIRFDIQDQIAVISYLVDPLFYGKGFGTILLKLGLKILADNYSEKEIKEIHGHVFKENIASIKAFQRFGFKQEINNDSLLFTKQFTKNEQYA